MHSDTNIPMDQNGDRDWNLLKANHLFARSPKEILACAKETFDDPAVASVVVETEWGQARVMRDGTIFAHKVGRN